MSQEILLNNRIHDGSRYCNTLNLALDQARELAALLNRACNIESTKEAGK